MSDAAVLPCRRRCDKQESALDAPSCSWGHQVTTTQTRAHVQHPGSSRALPHPQVTSALAVRGSPWLFVWCSRSTGRPFLWGWHSLLTRRSGQVSPGFTPLCVAWVTRSAPTELTGTYLQTSSRGHPCILLCPP